MVPPPTFLSISAPFYKYLRLLKATWKGKKLKDGIEVTTGNQTWDLPHRRPHTNQLRLSFLLRPEWAWMSQGGMRKRKKKTWKVDPKNSKENFVPLHTCTSFHLSLQFQKPSKCPVKEKTEARKGKEKGRRESEKNSRLLCHFLIWKQSQNFAFCRCPNFRSSRFESGTEGGI